MNQLKKIIFLPLFLIILSTYAQDENNTPEVKPIVKIYSNYHSGLNKYSNENGFEVNRAYLGFSIKLSDNLSIKTNIDVGNPKNGSSYEYTAYLKNAALIYKKGKLSVDFGLIGLKDFKLQEDTWGHRYVFKSFQDEYGFSHSADFGISAEYKFSDNFGIDATIRNGEGYKKPQGDKTYRGSLGLTYYLMNDLFIRGGYDVTSKSSTQSIISGLITYKYKELFVVGIEYNYLKNKNFNEDENQAGLSFYSSINLSKKFELFGRFDQLNSNTLAATGEPWNITKDGQAIIAGVQYKLDKRVKIATNIQHWSPAEDSYDKQLYFYINLEYKL